MEFITPIAPLAPMTFGDIESGKTTNEASSGFANVLKNAISTYTQEQKTVEADSMALALGSADDLHQVVINAMKAEASLQTVVQLTSRAVGAYKEIMQMSV